MPQIKTSTHSAKVTVPISGNPAERVVIDANGRAIGFEAIDSGSPEAALAKIVAFLEAALAEARRP